LGEDESSTVSSQVPPPGSWTSFFMTYRKSGGAQPRHKIRFWRVGHGWSGGMCLREDCERHKRERGTHDKHLTGLGECR